MLRILLMFAAGLALVLPARAAAPRASTFLYLPSLGTIQGFQLRPDGSLQSRGVMRLADYPVDLAAHPSGRFLYAATIDDQMHKGTVWALQVRPDGTLRRLSALRIKGSLGQVVVHPGGRLLYVTGEHRRILIFAIRPNGMLTRLPDTRVFETFSIGHGPFLSAWENAWLSFGASGAVAEMYHGVGSSDLSVQVLQAYHVVSSGRLRAWGNSLDDSTFDRESNVPPVKPEPDPVRFIPHRRLAAVQAGDGEWLCTLLRDGRLNYRSTWRIKNPRFDGTARFGSTGRYLSMMEADPKGRFLYLSTDSDPRAVDKVFFYVCRIGPCGQTGRPFRIAAQGALMPSPDGDYLYSAHRQLRSADDSVEKFTLFVQRVHSDGTVTAARRLPQTLPKEWEAKWVMVERRP